MFYYSTKKKKTNEIYKYIYYNRIVHIFIHYYHSLLSLRKIVLREKTPIRIL